LGDVEYTQFWVDHYKAEAPGQYFLKVNSTFTSEDLTATFTYVHPDLAGETPIVQGFRMTVSRAKFEFFTWDHRNRLTEVTHRTTVGANNSIQYTMPGGGQITLGEQNTKHYVHDAHGQLIYEYLTDPAGPAGPFSETVYIFERGRIVARYAEDLSANPLTLQNLLLPHPQQNFNLAEEYRNTTEHHTYH